MATWFEWDAVKAAANLRKHGISFDEAEIALKDPLAVSEPDGDEWRELRWRTTGRASHFTLLLVIHTAWDEDDGSELIRIISARKASPGECKTYEENRLRQTQG